MDEAQLVELKRILGAAVLAIPGVTGLGVGLGELNVYLERDDPTVRGLVESEIRTKHENVKINFVVTGPFRAQ